ncbi:MAG: DHH family phosphoesterase [Clostridia bacterium]|nr:DHH family phosphoesterase [Clostridia bacterium]
MKLKALKTLLKTAVKDFPVFIAAFAVAVICTVLTAILGNKWLALAELVLLIGIGFAIFMYLRSMRNAKLKILSDISSQLDFSDESSAEKIPMPMAVCSMSGEIIWNNTLFEKDVLGGGASETEMKGFFEEIGIESILNSGSAGIPIDYGNKNFTVFAHKIQKNGEDAAAIYLVETTKFHIIAQEYIKSRPSLIIMTIDNVYELQQDYRESDCSAIKNGVEKLIETWLSDYPCFISKVSEEKFCIVAEKRNTDDMIARRFDILDMVRDYTYDEKYVGVTLSIGVGFGATYSECEKNAKLSLDMALGRGGDQAVVKIKDNYEFFGGVSKSVESTNKVKSRIVASALTELIQGCDTVYIMGHRFPDFDAAGSAYGIACIARSLGKPAYIATDVSSSMAKNLLSRGEAEGFANTVISISQAKQDMLNGGSNLLVVVDTHIKSFVESTDLLSLSKMTVVIDHHRKAVDYIDDAVIFFHDPSASSTAEMVTELAEYTPATTRLGSFVADGLMAGIMLDTKNFVLRASSRTFEAAAFLKKQGADAVRAKQLFASDIDSYHERNAIISNAEKYKNCVIAVANETGDNMRMICSQAADELLNISGVDASFVIFRAGEAVCVSARSFGKVNVQIIMEYMNGGGHQTMAATQIKDSSIEAVTGLLTESIDKYNELRSKERAAR